jgi:hypothetical protein
MNQPSTISDAKMAGDNLATELEYLNSGRLLIPMPTSERIEFSGVWHWFSFA